MIETLPERITELPEHIRQICERLLYVDAVPGYTVVPPSMEDWVVQHFGALEAVREQRIVKVTNRLTLESALFNVVRARRPTRRGGGDAALEQWIDQELAEHDIFHDPERTTTADVFGRIRGKYCISASNVAKYDGWHGLVIFDDPHPLSFGAEQLRDFVDVALRWIAAAHAHDPSAIYPVITWNCLPKSGATLMHGHMQIALARGMHYAKVERWRRAAASYRAATGASYIGDLVALHAGLGLGIPLAGRVNGFAHLTAARNREIVLLGERGGEQGDREVRRQADLDTLSPNLPVSLSEGLVNALYRVLRGLIDGQGMRAFNLAIALPPLSPTAEDWSDLPAIVRLGDRGDPLTNRVDVGAMELFVAGCVTVDPFEVAAQLQNEHASK